MNSARVPSVTGASSPHHQGSHGDRYTCDEAAALRSTPVCSKQSGVKWIFAGHTFIAESSMQDRHDPVSRRHSHRTSSVPP
jgi:hypothetical protein